MAIDLHLLERMRSIMNAQKISWYEQKMFGGVCFMVDDKMCFGTYRGGLMVRVEPQETDELLKRPAVAKDVHGWKRDDWLSAG